MAEASWALPANKTAFSSDLPTCFANNCSELRPIRLAKKLVAVSALLRLCISASISAKAFVKLPPSLSKSVALASKVSKVIRSRGSNLLKRSSTRYAFSEFSFS